jgi:hypothetical protein
VSDNSYGNSEIGSSIICPYCGKEYEPSYEDTFIGGDSVNCYEEGNQGTFTCDDCGKRFKLYSTFRWEYETETIVGEMSEEEWEENYG